MRLPLGNRPQFGPYAGCIDPNDWRVCKIVNVLRFGKKLRLFLKNALETICIRFFVDDSNFLFDPDGIFDKDIGDSSDNFSSSNSRESRCPIDP